MTTNPFRGPRSLGSGDMLYGRDRELRELVHLLTEERIVLLYAVPGAGRSSLLHAKNGLISSMIRALRPFSLTRKEDLLDIWAKRTIRTLSQPPGAQPANRFAWSVIDSLEDGATGDSFLTMTVAEYVNGRVERPVLLVFDDFEQLLRTPGETDAKTGFFDQLGDMLTNPLVWALFTVNEESVGLLDRYRRLIPTALEKRFRLELYKPEDARATILGMARQARPITDDAVDHLLKLLSDRSDENQAVYADERAGYVEPLQLQLVCRQLWSAGPGLEGQTDENAPAITVSDVDNSNPTKALVNYYSATIQEAARAASGDPIREEYRIRVWVDERLILPSATRRASHLAHCPLSEATRSVLMDRNLVREGERLGERMLQLAHEKWVAPARESNTEWFHNLGQPLAGDGAARALEDYYTRAVLAALQAAAAPRAARAASELAMAAAAGVDSVPPRDPGGNSVEPGPGSERREYELREWIGSKLIDSAGLRLDIEERTSTLPKAALEVLIDWGVLNRVNERWIQISHERWVAPVRKSNEEWLKGLSELEVRARAWEQSDAGLRDSYLLLGRKLKQARKWAVANPHSRVDLTDFLAASTLRRRMRLRARIRWYGAAFAAFVALIYIVYRSSARAAAIEQADLGRQDLEDAERDGSAEGFVMAASHALASLDIRGQAAMLWGKDFGPSAGMVLRTVQNELPTITSVCSLPKKMFQTPGPGISPDGRTMFVGAGSDLFRCDESDVEAEGPPPAAKRVAEFGDYQVRRLGVAANLVAAIMTDGQHIGLVRFKDNKAQEPEILRVNHVAQSIAATPDGRWVASWGTGGLDLIRTGTEPGTSLTAKLTLPDQAISALALGSGWLVAGLGDSDIAWFRLNAEGAPSAVRVSGVAVENKPSVIAISPGGKWAAVGSRRPGVVSLLNLSTGNWTEVPKRFAEDIIQIRCDDSGKLLIGVRRANAVPAMMRVDGTPVLPFPGDFYTYRGPFATEQSTKATFSEDGKAAFILRGSVMILVRATEDPDGKAYAAALNSPVMAWDRCRISSNGSSSVCMTKTTASFWAASRMRVLFGAYTRGPDLDVNANCDDFAVSANGRYLLVVKSDVCPGGANPKVRRATASIFDLASGSKTNPGPELALPDLPLAHEYAITDRGDKIVYERQGRLFVDQLRSAVTGSPKCLPEETSQFWCLQKVDSYIGDESQEIFISVDAEGKDGLLADASGIYEWDVTDLKDDGFQLDADAATAHIIKIGADASRAVVARQDGRVRILDISSFMNSGKPVDEFVIPLTLSEILEDVGLDSNRLVALIRDQRGGRRTVEVDFNGERLREHVCAQVHRASPLINPDSFDEWCPEAGKKGK